jgi:phage terminase Nu1 subunit (DNA packaging protein)
MRTFFLGFKNAGSGRLTEFNTARQADYLAEEWAEVQADNLKEAKEKYESSFLAWQESAGLKV